MSSAKYRRCPRLGAWRGSSTRCKSAFTLIELLVVIAILAVIAAILFPVFAQARIKARASSCAGNQKQLATAMLMYTQDYDECFPLQDARHYDTDPVNGGGSFPPGWQHNDTPGSGTYDLSSAHWSNAIYPYIHNYGVYACPETIPDNYFRDSSLYKPHNRVPQICSYTYNGLLHNYPQSGIVAPASLPLTWEGRGHYAVTGEADSNPIIHEGPFFGVIPLNFRYKQPPPNTYLCGSPSPPAGAGAMYSYYPFTQFANLHSSGIIYAFTDGHVKWRKILGTKSDTPTDYMTDPFAFYAADGSVVSHWFSADGCFPYLFRPDYDFVTREPAMHKP